MGVDRTDYLMFATDVGYDNCDYDKFEAEISGEPGARFDIVYDRMCGKYALAGKIIAKSEPYDGFEMAKINVGAVLEANGIRPDGSDVGSRVHGSRLHCREDSMKVNDVVIWGEGADEHVWVIRGIHLGALGVESLIELENLSHKPGWTGEWMTHQMMFVPECLLRQCKVGRAIDLGV